ncbi:MAG: hypothetical protein FE78DRAFT_148885 [Acidomyces sp. 'richmondensis']|nr:MAG: hypothetical protein FE78DRAFT_148885 [Acidomyces sp. 'richmondensis']
MKDLFVPALEQSTSRQTESWRQPLIKCVSYCDLTFNQVANKYFRTLLLQSGTHIEYLIPTQNTVRSRIMKAFSDRKVDVQNSLARAVRQIHLSFGLWSSGNDNLSLATVGH